MEAKKPWEDTVMSAEQREFYRQKCHRAVADYLGKDIPDIKLSDMDADTIQICKDVALGELEAQAEITWSIAHKVGYDKALAQLVEMTEECKGIGRKEVVEWMRSYYEGKLILDCDSGRKQLKGWGLK